MSNCRSFASVCFGLASAALIALGLAGCGGDSLVASDDMLGSAVDGATATGDLAGPTCGNGQKDPGEDCDNGNGKNVKGSGCDPDCRFSCYPGSGVKGDPFCSDGDPCNGVETCDGAAHKCKSGPAAAAGASCGTGKICKSGVCGDVTCGDGVVTSPEECDDGNRTEGDGCNNNCKFSCISTDAARNCTPSDTCAGAGTCNDTTHVCSPAMPLADGTVCAKPAAGKCMMGVCTASLCGNGMLDNGEQCDNGLANGAGTGCELNCTFSCVNPANDCKAAPAPCTKWSCGAQHTCVAVADAAQNSMPCGMNLICKAGACLSPNAMCGNGFVEMGEDCDFGGGNGMGTGCEANCKFSCLKNPDNCSDGNLCNGTETCTSVVVNGVTGQMCAAGAVPAKGTMCGGMNVCSGGKCVAPSCGDAVLETARGEECDDGNNLNLDGCDAMCRFEQLQRINYFKMQFATDPYCAANGLGGAIVNNLAQMQVQTAIDNGIGNGSISILTQYLGLTDLSGTAEPNFKLGIFNAKNVAGAGYMGTADLDWWYTVSPMAIDANRLPLNTLNANIAAKLLNAGPGNISISITLAGTPAALNMSGAKLTASIGAVSTPTASMGAPPGHLMSENLKPTLQSFATTGQPNANGAAKLCGNVSALSLSQVKLPSALATQCAGYTVANSILDAVVGGCTAFIFVQLIKPTQPDQSAGVAVGAGPPYKLTADAQKAVNGCTDKSGAAVNLAMCLSDAAYSAYFQFATDRVIGK